MWIDAIGSKDELGPVEAVGDRDEECVAGTSVAGTGVAGTRSKAGAASIVMWSS